MRIIDLSSDVCSSDLLELVVILQIAAAELDSEIVLLPFGRQAALLDGIGVLLRLTDGDVRSDDRRIGPARRITFGPVIVQFGNCVRTVAVDRDAERRADAEAIADIGIVAGDRQSTRLNSRP